MSSSESYALLPIIPGEDTSMSTNPNKVCRILQHSEQEYQAALTGYAIAAYLDFVTTHLESMGHARDHLQQRGHTIDDRVH